MDLVLCVHCNRHVGVAETKCPFCRRSIALQRPQFAFASKLTRAAIFSAAVVACDSKKPTPAPVPPPQTGSATGSGSDDLEKMLDTDQRSVDHPAPVIDAGTADAAAMAAIVVDAGVDAAVASPEDIQRRQEQRREVLERREKLRKTMVERQREMAKPYGAPPARRRVV